MDIRSSKDMVAQADAAVRTLGPEQAVKLAGDPNTVFVDVRESGEVQKSGTLSGAVHAPRGFLEFMADPASPRHLSELSPGKQVVVFCGSGQRSALAARTLKEMGYPNVAHVAGGFGALKQAGGEISGG
ncbi:MAG TPA: rhodanese-like domain-containing protein [Acetobacteraceae bacterium]|nr:rhodanese-like domain-containing protein [Acetobacteraceae bacterium]